MESGMREYLAREKQSRKGKTKKMLLEWGGALDLCARKEEQLKKAERLRQEHRKLWENSDSPEGRRILAEIDLAYERELRQIQEGIAEILRRKGEVDEKIGKLGGEEQMFLMLRFGKGYGFEYIAMKMHMSEASVFRMQDRILREWEDERE